MLEHFKHPDTLIVVAYSIMMLHTDIYNPNVRRHAAVMTSAGFVANHRQIDAGEDLNPDFLRGIYTRVSANEFKSIPDITDRLREVDQLFTGALKFEKLVERHRRFVAWTAAYDVGDVVTKKSLILRTTSQLRGVFIFNDLLIVAKPSRSFAVDALLGICSAPVVDTAVFTHRRFRSLDRLTIHITSPAASIDASSVGSGASPPRYQTLKQSRNSQHQAGICSTNVPKNCPLQTRRVIPLEHVQVLVFESERE